MLSSIWRMLEETITASKSEREYLHKRGREGELLFLVPKNSHFSPVTVPLLASCHYLDTHRNIISVSENP